MGQLGAGQTVSTLERAVHLVAVQLESHRLGITQGEAHVLAQLARHGPTSIAALHHEFGHKRSTLTNILDRLEGRRLVRRLVNPEDRRSFVVQLTAPGRRRAARVTSALDELESGVAALVDERDLAGLDAVARALDSVVAHGRLIGDGDSGAARKRGTTRAPKSKENR